MATLPTGAVLTVISNGNTPHTGKYIATLSGSFTASDIVLDAAAATGLGIKPNHVRITNMTDRKSVEAVYGSVSGLVTVANGTRTYAEHGLTFADRSLSIDVSVLDVITSNDTSLIEIQS
jgi:hypothetical protein